MPSPQQMFAAYEALKGHQEARAVENRHLRPAAEARVARAEGAMEALAGLIDRDMEAAGVPRIDEEAA